MAFGGIRNLRSIFNNSNLQHVDTEQINTVFIELCENITSKTYEVKCLCGYIIDVKFRGENYDDDDDDDGRPIHMIYSDGLCKFKLPPIKNKLVLRMKGLPYLRIQFKCYKCDLNLHLIVFSYY
jgi:hypothetical protein